MSEEGCSDIGKKASESRRKIFSPGIGAAHDQRQTKTAASGTEDVAGDPEELGAARYR